MAESFSGAKRLHNRRLFFPLGGAAESQRSPTPRLFPMIPRPRGYRWP